MADPEGILENLGFADFVLENWHTRVYCPVSRKRVGSEMDPIADALIRIKNGYIVGRQIVTVRYSKLVLSILKLLEKEGYVGEVKKAGANIEVSLKYDGRVPSLTDIKRISKPSLRVYKRVADLPRVLGGVGIAIISTPQGVLSDREARKKNVGGEVLALVW